MTSTISHLAKSHHPNHHNVIGCPEGLDAKFLGEIKCATNLTLYIARDYQRMLSVNDSLNFFAPDAEILLFPPWDCQFYDRLSPTNAIVAQRLDCLSNLISLSDKINSPPIIVITSAQAIIQKIIPKPILKEGTLELIPGQTIALQSLEVYFKRFGYQRASIVSERGDFAIRGGVIDIFPSTLETPVRLDFFGETLESIRTFDRETQRSLSQLKLVQLRPVSEIHITTESIANFRQGFLEAFGAPGDDIYYSSVTAGIKRQGVESYFPLFYNELDSFFDYLPDNCNIVQAALVDSAIEEFSLSVKDSFDSRCAATTFSGNRIHFLPPDKLFWSASEYADHLNKYCTYRLEAFEGGHAQVIDLKGRRGRDFAVERLNDSMNLFESVVDHAKNLSSMGKNVFFSSHTEGASERLGLMLSDHGLGTTRLTPNFYEGLNFGVKGTKAKPIQRCILPLSHGVETDAVAIITETDILGDRLARKAKKRRANNFLAEASSLSQGDLIVHIEHGIGRYEGLKTLEVNEAPHDCLELHYANEAKLYLPVENIDLLTRYGSDSETAVLDRLGTAQWQARKSKAKAKLREMAEGLIALAAARLIKQGPHIDSSSGLFEEFCAQFPYEETDDQLSSIADVLEDLAKGHPMDRLICGDVGFGKTEVALRATFVSAMSGQQVAIICPTTLLARQHYRTFSERFKGWPIRVRQLSRLVSTKEANETREGLKRGEIEVVIGTHALLAESVGFKSLGLVVIDEEQHFGVKHKEKLKSFRADVHVLAMSATPIPRTLQMALSGIRDLSIISTPPVDRMAIRTYVLPRDPITLREAMLREKYRGGQIYYVVPRLSDIDKIAEYLRNQVPEISFVIGHGQLSATQLEAVMTAFYEGEYDLLLSTTIVESGLDVPTANTLIVHRADMFGLAQLYQIRGRVGRAKVRAYAYLTTEPDRILTDSAEKRLKLLQSLDSLGAGFQLASHDLDIRGGGNLLGQEQTGHIREVGVELYQQMLEEAVSQFKNDGASALFEQKGWSPQINVGAAIMIPEDYIADINIRLSLYRRVSEAEDVNEREALASELIDRFGPIPEEAEHLLKVIGLKGLSRVSNVAKLDVGPKGAVITFRDNQFSNPLGLINLIQTRPNDWRLRPDQKLLVKGDWPTEAQRLQAAEAIMGQLAKLSQTS